MIYKVNNEHNTEYILLLNLFIINAKNFILKNNVFISQTGILTAYKLESCIVLTSDIQNC